jgi:hypothetical protein
MLPRAIAMQRAKDPPRPLFASRRSYRLGSGPLLWGHDVRTINPKTGWSRSHCGADRHLGGVRRKHGADRRPMAYSCSDDFLSSDGNSLDYPLETTDYVDRDGLVQDHSLTRD